MYNKYPYTDFSELNLDWFLSEFKQLKEDWQSTSESWAQMQLNFQTLEGTVQTFTTFVENYFENLDVQEEVNTKLNEMAQDGSLADLLAPLVDDKLPDVVDDKLGAVVTDQLPGVVTDQLPGVVEDQIGDAVAPEVPSAVTAWLDDNVNPVGSAVTIDSSLTIRGSAADAEVVGQKVSPFDFITDSNFEDDTNIIADTTWTAGSMRGNDGTLVSSAYTTSYVASDFIAVVPEVEYKIYITESCQLLLEFYSDLKNDGSSVSTAWISAPGSYDVTIPSGKTFMAINCVANGSNKVYTVHRLTQYDSEKKVSIPRLIYGDQKWIGKTICNFGDSIFGQFSSPNDISTYLADLNGATVYNCAFGGCRMGTHPVAAWNSFSMYKLADAIASGDWTEQATSALDPTLPAYFSGRVSLLSSLDFSDVDIITISYGTNDFAGGLGLGGNTFDYTDAALRYSIDKILTAYPNIRIFVCMPMYRVWLDGGVFDEDSNQKEITSTVDGVTRKLTDFVAAEKEVCKQTQIPVLETYYDLGVNKFNWTEYFPSNDGTHFDVKGRKLIAEYIAEHLW